MCHCTPEGRERCDETVARVCRELETDQTLLFSNVVYSMQDLIDEKETRVWGMITSIPSDQWSAINATLHAWDRRTLEYREIVNIRVECDLLEHGLARVYELAVEAARDHHASIAQSG